jgi:hypothetical protein
MCGTLGDFRIRVNTARSDYDVEGYEQLQDISQYLQKV